jgi:nitrogen fixation-related uncharacterized protein
MIIAACSVTLVMLIVNIVFWKCVEP